MMIYSDMKIASPHAAMAEQDDLIEELADALKDCLAICLSRGERLGLDDGGPVLDKARAALKRYNEEG